MNTELTGKFIAKGTLGDEELEQKTTPLLVGVTHISMVRIDFGTNLSQLDMDREGAMSLGRALIESARSS